VRALYGSWFLVSLVYCLGAGILQEKWLLLEFLLFLEFIAYGLWFGLWFMVYGLWLLLSVFGFLGIMLLGRITRGAKK